MDYTEQLNTIISLIGDVKDLLTYVIGCLSIMGGYIVMRFLVHALRGD